jgi:hypothetical protein
MVRLQQLTGMRPQEVVELRSFDIDMGDPSCWEDRPNRHKGEHLEKDRTVFIGLKAQEILRPFLTLDVAGYLFSPRASEAERNAERHARRKTQLYDSHVRHQALKRNARRRRVLGDHYTVGAWNSRHPKTGLHKIRVRLDDLLYASPKWITDHAAEPIPFNHPSATSSPSLVAAWGEASKAVRRQVEEQQSRQPSPDGASINALTRQLIVDSTTVEIGSRHARLFSAAGNLAEFATVNDLVHAILTEPGLDTGLPPKEVRRQIDCGIEHARRQRGGGGANG